MTVHEAYTFSGPDRAITGILHDRTRTVTAGTPRQSCISGLEQCTPKPEVGGSNPLGRIWNQSVAASAGSDNPDRTRNVHTSPLCIDLFCGLGGWTEGFLAEGYDVIGFDIERHDYGTGGYPAQLVIQDVLTLHGSQFKDSAVIVASPPCQAYSYRAMPWMRAKALPPPDNSLFEACFRIQREACAAAGRYIPLIVENVRGAVPWVGRAKWHYGSFYLWGDVPALMPSCAARKVAIQSWSEFGRPGYRAQGFNVAAAQEWRKNSGGSWFNVAHNTRSGLANNPVSVPAGIKTAAHANVRDGYSHTRHLTNQRESDAVKQHGSGPIWFDTGIAALSSRSTSRKAASAQIAKIPFPLASHIARVFKPEVDQ